MKVKIGFVGYGEFARDFVNLFQQHPDVEEVCVAEIVSERRDDIRSQYPDIRIFDSYE